VCGPGVRTEGEKAEAEAYAARAVRKQEVVGINEVMIRKYVKFQEKHVVEESQTPLKEV